MMAKRKPQPVPNPFRRYACEFPDLPETAKKASLDIIRYHVRLAEQNKQWAAGMTPERIKQSSEVTKEMARDYSQQSLHVMARGSLEYQRYRAFIMLRKDGSSVDRPAWQLWRNLTQC